MKKERLDVLLVKKGLASSREKAKADHYVRNRFCRWTERG